MARIRSIKPEFPQSESIGKLSRDARLLFLQIWTIVDDSGRTRASSRMLASLLYPYDDDAKDLIQGWLVELEQNGHVRQYEVDGSRYLEVVNWSKHQKISHPAESRLPPFTDASRISIREDLAKPRESLATDLGPRIGKKESSPSVPMLACNGATATIIPMSIIQSNRPKPKPAKPYSEEFVNKFWLPYPRTPVMVKKEAWQEWLKLSPEDRQAACQAIEPFKRFLKKNPTHSIVHACRFLSQNRAEGLLEDASQRPDIRGHFA